MRLTRIGLVVNPTKPEAMQFANEVIAWLTERDVEVCVDESAAESMGRSDISADDTGLCRTQLLITIGGDGTILTASHIAAPLGVPILGVHMGHFGFIAETHPNELFPHLDEFLDGKTVQTEDRMMVRGEVIRDGKVVLSSVGLNDVVLNKGSSARMLRLHTAFGKDFVATYPADGLIVATPTGSSAYAMSAGGPLVEPTVQALLVVPICPHTLSARPLVIPADEEISVEIESDGGEVIFSADGFEPFALQTGDSLRARRAEYCTKLVTLGHASFYRKVRERLLWGERVNR